MDGRVEALVDEMDEEEAERAERLVALLVDHFKYRIAVALVVWASLGVVIGATAVSYGSYAHVTGAAVIAGAVALLADALFFR